MADKELPIVVCAPSSFKDPAMERFPDNVLGECSTCGEEVTHRPHIPTPSTLMCTGCFLERYDPETMELRITQETFQEVEDLLKREVQ